MKPLPCPFCGAVPKLSRRGSPFCFFMVMCQADECPANPAAEASNHDDAVARWNKRAPVNTPVEEIDLAEVPQQ